MSPVKWEGRGPVLRGVGPDNWTKTTSLVRRSDCLRGTMVGPLDNVSRRGDKFMLISLFLFLVFEVLQGPLRYYLSQAGGVILAYAPKALMLVVFIAVAIQALWSKRLSRLVLTVASLFVVSITVGFCFARSVSQPFLGIFSLVPMLFGVVAEPAVSRFGPRICPYALGLWLCVAVGVTFNYFHSVPWTGFTYQLGDAEVEVSREWTYFGANRIAGFARASFEAATQLLFLGLVSSILLGSRTLALTVWLVTGVLIAATTTKTTLGLYFFLTIAFCLVLPRFVQAGFQRAVKEVLPIVIALVGILLPIGSMFLSRATQSGDQGSGTLFASFAIRLQQMWPDTFAMIFNHGSVLLGRGIGGVGAAQKIFEPDLYSPADNMYLYLYATFGVFSLVIIWTVTRAVVRLRRGRDPMTTLVWLLGISILMEGWTISCIEGGTMAVITGLVVAFSVRFGKGASALNSPDGSSRQFDGMPHP